jgi:hypothetical protein
MPSEELLPEILEALSKPIFEFRSALATTVEQVRGGLESQDAGNNGGLDNLSAELGQFARDRIDLESFSHLVKKQAPLDRGALDRIKSAHSALLELAARREKLFHFALKPGANLRDEVAHALSEVGRAFKAARVIELTRSGRFGADGANPLLGDFRFRSWSRAERRLAPPQIVFLDSDDLFAGALCEFMDGGFKIVLVSDGPCSPAPLVRLVTPRTYLMQTDKVSDLREFASYEGCGVAALLPEGAARFVHDPRRGENFWDRVTIDFMPGEPKEAIGGRSIYQQAEELELLRALARKPEPVAVPVPVGGGSPSAPATPEDKLAAWLISQADLTDLEGTA